MCIIQFTLFFVRMHLCNSTEICDETRNNDLKICYLGARFFSLFVVYIREIRG